MPGFAEEASTSRRGICTDEDICPAPIIGGVDLEEWYELKNMS
jgi:hypothetical protein